MQEDRETYVTHTLKAEHDASEDGTGRGVPLVPAPSAVPILEVGKRQGLRADARDGLGVGAEGDPMFTLQAGAQHGVLAPVTVTQDSTPQQHEDVAPTLKVGTGLECGQPPARKAAGHTPDPDFIAAHETGPGFWQDGDVAGTIRAEGENRPSRPSNIIAFSSPTLCTDHASRPSDFCPIVFTQGNLARGEVPRPSPDTVPTLQANAGDQAPCVVSLMPQNSGKDFKAREVEVTQPIMAAGPTTGNQGGDLVIDKVPALDLTEDPAESVAVDVYNQTVDGDTTASVTAATGHPTASGPKDLGPRGEIAFTQEATPKQSEAACPALDAQEERRASRLTPGAPLQEDAVRRLTPLECERLQGFPDNYTLIDWGGARDAQDLAATVAYLRAHGLSQEAAEQLALTPDGPRYKALGNSMAVPVMAWIGWRIQQVEDLLSEKDKK